MNSPLAKLLLLTFFVGLGLWVGVKWFLQDSHEFSNSLDSRSLSYLRDKPAADASAGNPSAVGDLKAASPEVFKQPASKAPVQDLEDVVREASIPSEVIRKDDEEQGKEEEAAAAPEQILAEEEPVVLTAAEQIAQSDSLEETDTVIQAVEASDGSSEASAIRLSEEELKERENARLERLAQLGLVSKKRPAPTIAIDASLNLPSNCAGAITASVPVGLKFRHESAVIRGESLNALEALVALYRQCEQGEFVLAENPLGREDATDALTQMRFDEVKYFFIQHSVSIDSVQFPEAK